MNLTPPSAENGSIVKAGTLQCYEILLASLEPVNSTMATVRVVELRLPLPAEVGPVGQPLEWRDLFPTLNQYENV